MLEVCRKPEPLGLRLPAKSEAVESFETRDSDDALGECPCRCDVTYGLRVLDVLRGAGEYGRLAGCCVAGPEAAAPEASRSSHMAAWFSKGNARILSHVSIEV